MKGNLLIIAIAGLLLTSCKKTDYKKIFDNPSLFSSTVYELNSVVMGNNFSPVVASRNYAYASVAAYEVISAGDPAHYKSLVGQLNGFKEVAKPFKGFSINFPYASLLAFCKVGEAVTFPEGSLKYYTDSLHQLAVAHGMPADMIRNSETYAMAVAASVIDWSKKDNYAKTRTMPKFAINDVPGRWVPTPPMYG